MENLKVARAAIWIVYHMQFKESPLLKNLFLVIIIRNNLQDRAFSEIHQIKAKS